LPLFRHPNILDQRKLSVYLKSQLLLASPFVHPAIAFKNCAISLYSPDFTYAQDLMLFIDNINNGPYSYDPRTYLYYRNTIATSKKLSLQLLLHDKSINTLHRSINPYVSFFIRIVSVYLA